MVRCGLSTIYRHLDRVGSWPGVAKVNQLSSSDAVELIPARFIRGATDPTMHRIISVSLFMHPGFIIVDHIHFQYNGFMYGILLWSILMARNVGKAYSSSAISADYFTQGNKLTSGVLFAILLNFKHIYMYLAVSLLLLHPVIDLIHPSARIFRLSSQDLLYVACRRNPPCPIFISRQCCYSCLSRISWAIRFNGTATPALIQAFPLHSWPEPCILGSQRMGLSNRS